jgi:hypothetical protein
LAELKAFNATELSSKELDSSYLGVLSSLPEDFHSHRKEVERKYRSKIGILIVFRTHEEGGYDFRPVLILAKQPSSALECV